MAQKRHEIHPAQTAMPIEPPTVYGSEGSYMCVAEHAENLIIALDQVSYRNQRDPGFEVASRARSYNRPIRERYNNALRAVQMGAKDNAREAERWTKEHLWRASGYTAMRHMEPRLIFDSEIDARGKKMWRDFDATIGHSSHAADRARLRRNLVKTLKWINEGCVEAELPLEAAA